MSWIVQLASDLRNEFGDKPCVVTLATLAGDRPDARSVVVREFTDEGAMLFTSDARNEKNAQLRVNSSATVVWWLPTLRRQYRMDGQIEFLDGTHPWRKKLWQNASDATRAMFFWPSPGDRFDPTMVCPRNVDADTAVPSSFEVLRLCPWRVQTLDLNTCPHLRHRWTRAGLEWSVERINA